MRMTLRCRSMIGTEVSVVDEGDGSGVWGETFGVLDELLDLEALGLHELEGLGEICGGDGGVL